MFEGLEPADACRKLLLEKKPAEAVLAQVRAVPGVYLAGVGRVKDGRIRAWLEKLRRNREDYASATGQLMLMGDADARRETWAVMTTGRYRWVDNADVEVMTLDYDFATIPFWISELESNCCRFVVVAQIFEDLFGIDLDDFRVTMRSTPSEIVAEFFERHRGHLVGSRMAGHFVPAAR